MLHLTRNRLTHESKPEKGKSAQNEQNGYSLSNIKPPVTGKVSHHSIELNWERIDKKGRGDHNRVKYAIQEEDKRTLGFGTVYVGYADSYNIEGLEPLQKYKYRLKVTNEKGEAAHSPIIEVVTPKEPFTSLHLHKAITRKNAEKVEGILKSGEANIEAVDKLGFTPLMSAAQIGDVRIVDLLIQYGADVNASNSSGKTSLMYAAFSGNLDIVKQLREHGASLEWKDRGGSTAIHSAVDSCNVELIEWLIADGANINETDETAFWTPLLRCAVLSGNADVARCLLRAGAHVNADDKDGKTALMIASLNGHLDLVKLLVKSGAYVDAKSKYGKTAREMAKSFDRRRILEFYDEEFPVE